MTATITKFAAQERGGQRPVRLLICDDSVFMRMALVALCEDHPEIEIVGEAENGLEAVEAARRLQPDVITMDIAMPHQDGISATREILSEADTSIIVLSSLSEQRHTLANELLNLGAVDVIWKSASMLDIDLDGIAATMLEKIIFWGRNSFGSEQDEIGDSPKIEILVKRKEPKLLLLKAGAGSVPILKDIVETFSTGCLPVLISANVPRSCIESLETFLKRKSIRPLMPVEDGLGLETGVTYIMNEQSRFGVIGERGSCRFRPLALLDAKDNLITTLVKSGYLPVTIALPGVSDEYLLHPENVFSGGQFCFLGEKGRSLQTAPSKEWISINSRIHLNRVLEIL